MQRRSHRFALVPYSFPRKDASTGANQGDCDPTAERIVEERRAASAGFAPRTSTGRSRRIVTTWRHLDVAGIDELVDRPPHLDPASVHGNHAEGDDPVAKRVGPVSSKSSDAYRARSPGCVASPTGPS